MKITENFTKITRNSSPSEKPGMSTVQSESKMSFVKRSYRPSRAFLAAVYECVLVLDEVCGEGTTLDDVFAYFDHASLSRFSTGFLKHKLKKALDYGVYDGRFYAVGSHFKIYRHPV